jgi:hypothetical protein
VAKAFCRSLIQNQWIDEAWARLQTIQLDSLSDPSSWLFSTGVCQHYLLLKQPCMESLNKLLERESEIPSRYAITARLMLSDIEPLKQDSLDEVARMMNDVERRLTLGRTGNNHSNSKDSSSNSSGNGNNKISSNSSKKLHRIPSQEVGTVRAKLMIRTSAINQAGETSPRQPARKLSKISQKTYRATTARLSRLISNASRNPLKNN